MAKYRVRMDCSDENSRRCTLCRPALDALQHVQSAMRLATTSDCHDCVDLLHIEEGHTVDGEGAYQPYCRCCTASLSPVYHPLDGMIESFPPDEGPTC